MDEKANLVCLLFSPKDQSVFCAYDNVMMYPVPNAWGKKGATYVNMKKVRKDLFKDALRVAYCSKAPEKLAVRYRVL